MQGLALLLLLIAVFFFWYFSTKALEQARRIGQQACGEAGVQFLDETVYLKKFWPTRLPSGWVGMLRFYHFDYADEHGDRRRGLIVLAGRQLEYLQMEKGGLSVITSGRVQEPEDPD